MLTLVHRCARCGGELEVELPAVNSSGDMVVIVSECWECAISYEAYDEMQQELTIKEQRIADLKYKIEQELGGVA